MIARFRQNIRFLHRRPVLAVRAATNTVWAKIGRPRLRSIDLDLTYACPLACAQCYSAEYMSSPTPEPDLSLAELKGVLKQARGLGAIHTNLSGGEALLRQDLDHIIRAARQSGMLVSLCTSGMGLRQKRIERLKNAGLDVLLLSLDSDHADIHDTNRGIPGLYQTVLDAASYARSLGLLIGFNTVATAEKIQDGTLLRLARLAEQQKAHLNLTVPVAIGRWANQPSQQLKLPERQAFLRLLKHPNIRTDTTGNYGAPGCPAGLEKLAVSPSGEVRACQVLPGNLGHLRHRPLNEVWRDTRRATRHLRGEIFCPAGQDIPPLRQT